MAILKSKKAKPFEVMLTNGKNVVVPAYGQADCPDDQLQSPHLLACEKAGMLLIRKEKQRETPQPRMATPPPPTESPPPPKTTTTVDKKGWGRRRRSKK